MVIIWIIAAIFFIWMLTLTFFFWNLFVHYNMLIKTTPKKTVQALLELLLSEVEVTKKDIAFLKDRCDTIEKEGQFHIQKVGLVRFNPFKDTGGDQSFILSFVDAKNTGVIISGLHSRSGIRWYAKKIVAGKGVDYDLSDEEKKALLHAQQITK